MKLINIFKNGLMGKVGNEFFQQNKEVLAEANYFILKKACIFSSFMCLFLFILTFINPLIANLKVFYIFYVLFFLVETLIVFIYVRKHKNLTELFYYIYAIAILYLSADIGTFRSVDQYAVTFFVFLIIIPMLHICRPIYSVFLSVGACIGFCVMTYLIKKDNPNIAGNDILNSICCCIVGIALNVIIINIQLENLKAKIDFENLSSTDELTTLPNRRWFNLNIDKIFQNDCDNFCIIMMDIDNFKGFNDAYGHLKGDECLQKIGLLMHKVAEENSLLVARFGGEEFIAINTYNHFDKLQSICDNIINEINALDIEHIKSSYGKITMSIGYASVKDTSAKTYVELIGYADEALYFSKNNGKSRATPYSEVILDKTKKEEETKDPVEMTKV